MGEKHLLYEVKDGAAWMTLNREDRRNALSLPMIDQFFEFLDMAGADDSVRVICLTGAGGKVFCSGADLASSFEREDHVAGARKYAKLLKKLASYAKPIVGRINGHCLAGGLGLLLSCDISYARDDVKFGTPEVSVGLFPMMIGHLILSNAVRKKALEMIYTAKTISAAEAEAMGLITRVVPAGELDDVVRQTLGAVASKAPLAIKIGRYALAVAEDRGFDEALDYLCDKLGEVVETEDAKEGLMAFMQKRTPDWKGR